MAFVTLGIGLASLLMAIEHLSVLYLGVVVVAFAAFFYFNRENAPCRLNRSSLRRSTQPYISSWLSKNCTWIILYLSKLHSTSGAKQPQWQGSLCSQGLRW